jgi:diadenosine tetraphosphate (Ap4A) HIT family hydrolase
MKEVKLSNSSVPWTDPVKEDFHVVVYADKYPVTPGHLLFVPKYNTIDVVQHAFFDAYQHGEKLVKDGTIDGFNVGLNFGAAAGQTVDYPHVHFIPRRVGDTENPVGGVRAVIPGKADYRKQ